MNLCLLSADRRISRYLFPRSLDEMRPVGIIKRAGLRVCTLPGVRRLYRPLLEDAAVIFMLHRFSDPERSVSGTEPDHLGACLEWLREQGRTLLSLEDLVRRCIRGERMPPGATCFTVDDGYEDFFRVGLDVFVEHDCPVTVFLPTGFLDGDCWLWWDRIEYMLERTDRRSVQTSVPGATRSRLESSADREAVFHELVAALKRVPDERREAALDALGEATGVTLPAKPPPRYRPMTWDQVREAEKRGKVRFAPHSLTHPVLSQTDAARLAREISGSWDRLREEVDEPVPVFAYPDGATFTFGRREGRAVRDAGLLAALGAHGGYVDCREVSGSGSELRWRLPRFGLPGRRLAFLQIVTGLLRLRHLLGGDAR